MGRNSFFSNNNFIFRYSNYILDMAALSILWLFLSLPVVTAGGATAALYYTVSRHTRKGHVLPYHHYLRSFKENVKIGIPCSLLTTAALGLLWVGLTMMRSLASYDGQYMVIYAMYYFACFLPLGVICYAFPLLGRFTFGVKDLICTAFQLSICHLPTTILLVVLVVLTACVCLSLYWTVLFLPAITAVVMSLFLERIFKQYAPEDPSSADPLEEEPIE